MISIVNNGPITAAELRGITSLARTKEDCAFNQEVKEIYDDTITIVMKRAADGYSDYNMNSYNTIWCGKPSHTEALHKVAQMLAENHNFNVKWYWDKNNIHCCKSILIDWENDGCGHLNITYI